MPWSVPILSLFPPKASTHLPDNLSVIPAFKWVSFGSLDCNWQDSSSMGDPHNFFWWFSFESTGPLLHWHASACEKKHGDHCLGFSRRILSCSDWLKLLGDRQPRILYCFCSTPPSHPTPKPINSQPWWHPSAGGLASVMWAAGRVWSTPHWSALVIWILQPHTPSRLHLLSLFLRL